MDLYAGVHGLFDFPFMASAHALSAAAIEIDTDKHRITTTLVDHTGRLVAASDRSVNCTAVRQIWKWIGSVW